MESGSSLDTLVFGELGGSCGFVARVPGNAVVEQGRS